MEKLISIIVATFNAGNTLPNCLRSIAEQKIEEVELIIIDGGSVDNTKQIVSEHQNIIDIFLSEKDQGIYDAWNKGVKMAKGSWIMFLGADDELLPNAINNYITFLKRLDKNTHIDFICALDDLVSQNGVFLKKLGEEPTWNRMKFNMAAAHVASLHSREKLFDEVGLYDLKYKICGDYELLLRKRERLRYVFLDNCTMARMKEGGMSASWKAVIETYKIRRDHHTITKALNLLVLLKSLLGYKFYKFHK